MNKKECTILFAEDEIGIRENIAESLRYKFKDVFEAADGAIAYKLYEGHKPDIILTDIHMPNMDGMTLIKKIRETNVDIPIIVLSGASEHTLLLDAIKLNLVEYIIKPVTKNSLMNALDSATKRLSTRFDRYDYLTSVRTRRGLENDFELILQRHLDSKIRAGVIFVDVDNFKLINDSMGHLFGDKILQQIAKILTQNTRKNDILVRWGGDEFIILLDDINEDELQEIAKTLRYKVDNLEFEGYNDFTCSFGIDMLQATDTLDDLIGRVDKALLQGKKISKNCVVRYDVLS